MTSKTFGGQLVKHSRIHAATFQAGAVATMIKSGASCHLLNIHSSYLLSLTMAIMLKTLVNGGLSKNCKAGGVDGRLLFAGYE